MRTAAKRRAIQWANEAVNVSVLLVILLLLALGCYAMWDSKRVYQAAHAARYEIYKPSAEKGELSFRQLQTLNPEVFAWLTVYGTHIDYPVTQGPDNMKYVNTNAHGDYSLSGAIFLDSGCNRDFTGFPSILYGHHMEKNTMFGEIGNFAEKSTFDARQYGMLYYGGQEHGLEFFAFLRADAYDGSVFRTQLGQGARQAYLNLLLSRALYTRSVGVTAQDRIVLLSTCSASATNGRDILAARITDERYDNPFKTNETDKKGSALAVDGLPGLWTRIPLWGQVLVLVLPPLLLRFLALTIMKKRRSHEKRNHA